MIGKYAVADESTLPPDILAPLIKIYDNNSNIIWIAKITELLSLISNTHFQYFVSMPIVSGVKIRSDVNHLTIAYLARIKKGADCRLN